MQRTVGDFTNGNVAPFLENRYVNAYDPPTIHEIHVGVSSVKVRLIRHREDDSGQRTDVVLKDFVLDFSTKISDGFTTYGESGDLQWTERATTGICSGK